MTLVIGQTLQNRYRVVALLGQGGMGAVYLAEDLRLPGRHCAIKEAAPNPGASPQARAQLSQQFSTEAGILARLNHRNLPTVHDFFELGGSEYLVMEYVEGQDLQTVLDRHMQQRGTPLPEKSVLLWIDQVLDALTYLHRQRPQAIIHRDIKPANIILTPDDRVKLVDFGLVKVLNQASPRTVQAVQGLGTPPYTPLEQYGGGGHTDARSDIYSLGVTLYVLLTGALPPDAPEIASDPASLPPPRSIRSSVSPAANAAILKAMANQPNQRFQTAVEMRQALAPSLPTSPTGAPPSYRRKPVSGLLWTAIVVMVLLAGIVFGGRRLLAIAVQPAPPSGPAGIVSGATPSPSTVSHISATLLVTPVAASEPASLATSTIAAPSVATTASTAAMPAVATSTLAPLSAREPPTAAPPTATATRLSQADAVVSGQTLNLRDGPGTGYSVLGAYTQGTEVDVQGRNAAGDWLQVRMQDGRVGWMAADLLRVNVPLAQVVVATAPSPPAPPPTPVAPTRSAPVPVAPTVEPPTASPPAAGPGGNWVLVADSIGDFPGPLPEHKWWYLWSVGRFNFRWQDMAYDGGCYHSPNDWQLQICSDRVFLDDRGDLSLQYKAPRGGTYRFDWQAGDTIEFYKHANRVASGASGSQVIEDVIDWELFFFVARGRSREYPLAVQVYRWHE